jgi:hypothetical protein
MRYALHARRTFGIGFGFGFIVAFGLLASALRAGEPPADLVRRVAATEALDERERNNYTWRQTFVVEELNAKGVVKSQRLAVSQERGGKHENLFPHFTTTRRKVDGHWFPSLTLGDDTLLFRSGPLRERLRLRFGLRSRRQRMALSHNYFVEPGAGRSGAAGAIAAELLSYRSTTSLVISMVLDA